jgi:hypothetical protein
MNMSMNVNKYVFLAILSASSAMYAQTERMKVRIIDGQTHETNYTYQVPGYSHTTTNGSAWCSDYSCTGPSNTSTVTTAPQTVSFNVTGATFSLLLPDHRIAIVNCVSKFHSCRVPLVDTLEVEFKGKNAKLEWAVSVDGKKMKSETYTILGVLPCQRPAPIAGQKDMPATSPAQGRLGAL